MTGVWIAVAVAAVLIVLILAVAYFCFFLAFYVPDRDKPQKEEYPMPVGKIYEPFRDTMVAWMKEVRMLPHEEFSIRSFDGLKLCGKYYEYAPDAPIEIMFHGYRGSAERDLCGGVQRCFALGRSALIVDQRGSGKSEGRIISFGINESRDCHKWIDFVISHFGPEVKIILTGISMGAATVMMAAGKALPKNVVGVLADCGYTSPKEIIKRVIRQMKLPANLLYPFVKLGARLYGGFNLEESSPLEAMKRCTVPVIFFHGETDDFVPCDMSRANYAACAAEKKLVTVPMAGHGLGYLVDGKGYLAALADFASTWGLTVSLNPDNG
ncbi:MAG: alpha/beta hydrolase [Oscillospiraceae bacterium]|nr:alpha/beta hydrolase [Oscillospiraceae bacterium]